MTEPTTDVAMAAPTPALQGLIDNYIGYDMRGYAPGTHRGLPSRQLTFIISIEDPVEMAELPGFACSPTSMTAFVGGLAAAPALIRHDGTQAGVAIELTPLGARTLLGVPASALAWDVVELPDLLGASGHELTDRVAGATGWAERFAAIDEVLTRGARDAPPPSPEVVHAWNCLSHTDGSMGVNELAREIGWSRRHLSERFRAELGLTPKVMGRVMRFERTRMMLQRRSYHLGLSDIAATCGYYDQAHMNRDWKELAGCSPTTWMAEELPSVQDELAHVSGC